MCGAPAADAKSEYIRFFRLRFTLFVLFLTAKYLRSEGTLRDACRMLRNWVDELFFIEYFDLLSPGSIGYCDIHGNDCKSGSPLNGSIRQIDYSLNSTIRINKNNVITIVYDIKIGNKIL